MKFKIPKDWKPSEVSFPKKSKNDGYAHWWVYLSNGSAKSYKEASGKEAYEFAKSLFDKIPIKNSSVLDLMITRSVVLDNYLDIAIAKSRDLFGGAEFWNSLDNWERASKIFKKKEE